MNFGSNVCRAACTEYESVATLTDPILRQLYENNKAMITWKLRTTLTDCRSEGGGAAAARTSWYDVIVVVVAGFALCPRHMSMLLRANANKKCDVIVKLFVTTTITLVDIYTPSHIYVGNDLMFHHRHRRHHGDDVPLRYYGGALECTIDHATASNNTNQLRTSLTQDNALRILTWL